MKFEYFSLTDPGLIRGNNEDAVVVDDQHHIAVLADGMGGYNAGEVASAMAINHIRAELADWLAGAGQHASAREVKHEMEICADNANRHIFEAARRNADYAGMGTTLVLGLFQPGHAFIGHVGDSRCYRLRGRELQLLTRDHSLLQEQIDAGLITPELAQYAVHRNLVTRALGVEDTVLLEVNEFRLEVGDLYLLCSDGLNDMLRDEQIAAVLARPSALADKGRALVEAANEQGGRDNISIILIHVQTNNPRRSLFSRVLGQH